MPTWSRLCHSNSTSPLSMSTSWAARPAQRRPSDHLQTRGPSSGTVDRDQRRVLRGDEELVVVALVTVASSNPPHLPVGGVEDHVLSATVGHTGTHVVGQEQARRGSAAPCSPWPSRLRRVQAETTQLPCVVDDHRSEPSRALFRGEEDVASGAVSRSCHPDAGRPEIEPRPER